LILIESVAFNTRIADGVHHHDLCADFSRQNKKLPGSGLGVCVWTFSKEGKLVPLALNLPEVHSHYKIFRSFLSLSAKIFQNRGTQHITGTVSKEATSGVGYWI